MENKILEEEIIKLKVESKALKIQSYFYVFKVFATIIGGIILFIAIQKPESILNHKVSEETISRERTKLILDLLKEKDPRTISLGLEVIESSYPNSEEWLKKIKKTFNEQASIKTINTLTKRLEKLTKEKEVLKVKLHKELTGGDSGTMGYGPIAKMYQDQLKVIEIEISNINKSLMKYGVKSK